MSTPRPKKKAVRNQPLLYDQTKVKKAIWLTPFTWDTLKQAAETEGISISELIERWGRQLKLPPASSHP